nr:hypothetical protein [uncultured Ruminococcus sp.]
MYRIKKRANKISDLANELTENNPDQLLLLLEETECLLADIFKKAPKIYSTYKAKESNEVSQSPQAQAALNRIINIYRKCEYKFECLSNGYKLTIPPLISRRATSQPTYSPRKRYIYKVTETLLESNEAEINKLSEATVIIRSYYNELAARDCDNSDIHDIINLINKYIMSTSDDCEHMNIVCDGTKSDCDMTVVYIINMLDFSKFCK